MTAIVITDRDWGIAKDGRQIVVLRRDLARFKKLTTNHDVIVGSKTLETFPNQKPLPNRRNIILTRDRTFSVPGAHLICHSRLAAVALAELDAFVAGGEMIYRLFLPECDRVLRTVVDARLDADRFFPNLDADPDWRLVETGPRETENGFTFRYETWERV